MAVILHVSTSSAVIMVLSSRLTPLLLESCTGDSKSWTWQEENSKTRCSSPFYFSIVKTGRYSNIFFNSMHQQKHRQYIANIWLNPISHLYPYPLHFSLPSPEQNSKEKWVISQILGPILINIISHHLPSLPPMESEAIGLFKYAVFTLQ